MRYIGKRKGDFAPTYLGSGIRLKLAIKIYGRKSFSVSLVETAETRDDLNRLERQYIERYDAMRSPDFYNIAEGGEGGITYLDRNRHNMRRAAERYANLEEMLKTMTQSEIAQTLGVDQSAVAQRIREYHIVAERTDEYLNKVQSKREAAAKLAHEARRRKEQEKWEGHDLAAMYETMTQAEIARIVGVSQVAVSRKLRLMGINKKPG